MSISVLQSNYKDFSAAAANITVAFPGNLTSGSAIHAAGCSNELTGSNTITDSSNNTYTALDTVEDNTNVITTSQACADSPVTGVNPTVKSTPSTGSVGFQAITIIEIGSSSGHDGTKHNEIVRTTPGTTANAITGTAVTPTSQPGLISAIIIDPSTTGGNLSVGTTVAFTNANGQLNHNTTLGQVLTESFRYTSTASIQATAGDSTDGAADTYTVCTCLFVESGTADVLLGAICLV